ncbi:MAG: GNAT family protein, partial [Bacteroidota bacterium]
RDPSIWTFFEEQGQDDPSFSQYFSHALDQVREGSQYPYAVFDKRSQQFAGMTRLYQYSPESLNIKVGHTWYGATFRGTGLNKHSKYLLFQFLFDHLGLQRIGLAAHQENIVSLSAMKSVGCREEGRLRSFFRSIDGKGYADCVLFSILQSEWQQSVQTMLSQKLDFSASAR